MPDAETIRDAIIACLRENGGGPMSASNINAWIQGRFPHRWKGVATDLAELTIGGNPDSTYKDYQRCVIRVERGIYRLDPALMSSISIDGPLTATKASEPDGPSRSWLPPEQNREITCGMMMGAIERFNRATLNPMADWLLDYCFREFDSSNLRAKIASRVTILDALYNTNLKDGERFWLCEQLIAHAQEFQDTLLSVRTVSILTDPGAVILAAQRVCGFLFPSDKSAGVRNNFSFVTKYLHWCGREQFCIVDSNARYALNCRQETLGTPPEQRVLLLKTDEILGSAQLREYPVWVAAICDVMNSVGENEWQAIESADRDSTSQQYRIANSRLRIVDKVLYQLGKEWRGQDQ